MNDQYPKFQTPSGNWTTDRERAERLWQKQRNAPVPAARKVGMDEPLSLINDEAVNMIAKSWGAAPQRADGIADGGLPCIQVAGVTVWLYRENGLMRVSVDFDDADETTPGWRDADGNVTVPVQVAVGGEVVWDSLEGS
jgi:hypothetical protein